jgi:hypothetical protein
MVLSFLNRAHEDKSCSRMPYFSCIVYVPNSVHPKLYPKQLMNMHVQYDVTTDLAEGSTKPQWPQTTIHRCCERVQETHRANKHVCHKKIESAFRYRGQISHNDSNRKIKRRFHAMYILQWLGYAISRSSCDMLQ